MLAFCADSEPNSTVSSVLTGFGYATMLNDVDSPTRGHTVDTTAKILTADVPHAFTAFTVTIPFADAVGPYVMLMILVP
jgi:hypothetical protein